MSKKLTPAQPAWKELTQLAMQSHNTWQRWGEQPGRSDALRASAFALADAFVLCATILARMAYDIDSATVQPPPHRLYSPPA